MPSLHLKHPWPAIFDSNSRLLILGTFPSPQSRRFGYPYGHPQNLFWEVLAKSLQQRALPSDSNREQRIAWLLANRIALWDVLAACDIEGASDASIANPEVQQFRPIIEASQIAAVFTTGRKATLLFNAHCTAEAGLTARYLPSTSPANRAQHSKQEFFALWSEVGRQLNLDAGQAAILADIGTV